MVELTWAYLAASTITGGILEVLCGWILLKYIVPRTTADSATKIVHDLKKDPDIAPIIDKAKEIVDKLHPLAEQFKNIDLEKIQRDFTPLYESLKTIDPEDISALMKALRELAGTVTKAIEKPKTPLPEPTDN